MVGTPQRSWRVAAAGAAAAALGLGLAGCGGSTNTATPGASSTGTGAPLLLAGPDTDITVAIPAGWHQVIDSADPSVPEMVTPTSCMGSNEVSCSVGLARLANLTASSAATAAQAVQTAVDSGTGVTAGTTISGGPQQVAGRAGYLLRFHFSNGSGALTSAIAAVPTGTISTPPSGSGTPSPSPSPSGSESGDRQFAVVLVWVSAKAGAADSGVIDQIIDSATFTNGSP